MKISVSKRTIQRCLNKNGLHSYRPRPTPLHKLCHITASLNFEKSHLDIEKGFWNRVLWSHEIKIEFFGHNNVKKIWRRKVEALLPKNFLPALKHRDCFMMFRGCFSSICTEILVAIEGIMKFNDHITILDENLKTSA